MDSGSSDRLPSMEFVRSRVARGIGIALLGTALAGCDAISRTSPAASLVPGIDWGRVQSVERPANYEETVSPSYVAAHPILRIQGQATLSDLTTLSGGGFVAVGYAPPDWVPFAWTSADGARWSIHPMGSTEFTFPVAAATGTDGTVVAVGRSGAEPVAWTTRDGVAWDRHAVAVLPGGKAPERMTAVTAGPNGFVAGGSIGPELSDRHARFWTSADGSTWVPAPDDAAVFANAEVRSITSFAEGFLAVGVVGTVQEPTGAVAWFSTDGSAWKRIDDPAFDGGIAASVAVAPWGGFVAVGSTIDRKSAVAWVAKDGLAWTRAPDEPSRQHSGGFAWMTDVVAIGDQVVGVGDVQGLQRGTAEGWVSRDGLSWTMSNSAPVQEGAEFYAVVPSGSGALSVGAFGAPDSYVPEVWITPGR
jgi:hypothetical protein